ncbi:uncharacterized protein [Arachis hypogaea]|uniref:uncharacterized protein n=1 Tax=Arachis hypogaea TaxID=3818 RepID=UPI003B21065C
MYFIKKCWNEIGTEFTAAVMDFFETARLPADANVTWVALAPKFVGAKEIKDLRPISMVGCVYKCNGSNRRRRHQRLLNSTSKKPMTKSNGVLLILCWRRWDSEENGGHGFGSVLHRLQSLFWLMGHHRNHSKWKGDYVKVTLLSSFLFVLMVDVLNRMIGEAVRNGRISPLLVGRDNIELSHLQFDDDTILFFPPEEETLKNYKRLLRCFEMMSGLSINFEKSNLIPVNCSSEWVNKMCQLLGCQEVALPVRYLGISLGANLRLPIYYLSLYKMPNAVAQRIISLQRRFFWGKDDGRLGIALVKWELVQAPKKLGGLGVGDAVVRNTALVFKWWWRFSKEDCPLWKQIVLQEETLDEEFLRYRLTKEIWKGLVPPRVELFAWFVLVWCAWISAFGEIWVVPGNLKEHYESWRSVPMRKDRRKYWLLGFFSVMWSIWLRRNDAIFHNKITGIADYVEQSFSCATKWRCK